MENYIILRYTYIYMYIKTHRIGYSMYTCMYIYRYIHIYIYSYIFLACVYIYIHVRLHVAAAVQDRRRLTQGPDVSKCDGPSPFDPQAPKTWPLERTGACGGFIKSRVPFWGSP